MKILVTGGAGFIGSHIVDLLVAGDHKVVVMDNYEKQVHPEGEPTYKNKSAKYYSFDITNPNALNMIMDKEKPEIIFHQAAMVGMGQSQYDITKYFKTNVLGTANLLDYLANHEHNVKKIIVAGSMSAYGEGLYYCKNCKDNVYPPIRKEGIKIKCPHCDKEVKSRQTPEWKPLQSTNMYSLTKKYQEEMCLAFGKTYNLPVIVTRYFNVYGPRQQLSNPYTGVAAMFTSQLMNGHSPRIFEDGLQTRDFIHVTDVARANVFLMMSKEAFGVYNIGTSKRTTIKELAERLSKELGVGIAPHILGTLRPSDVRHCYANNGRLIELGFDLMYPELDIKELITWAKTQQPEDKISEALDEMETKGLL